MRTVKYLLVGVAALLLSGCWTLSVHPLYTEKDLVADPMLVGKWYSPDDLDQLWMFESNGEKVYRLYIIEGIEEQLREAVENKSRLVLTVDPEKDAVFEIHLLKLGGDTFMDFFPEEPANVNEFYKYHVIPAHSFSRVSVEGHVMQLGFFDSEWLMERLDNDEVPIKVEEWDDLKVITASTEDLQKFILDHVDEAFETPQVFHRLE